MTEPCFLDDLPLTLPYELTSALKDAHGLPAIGAVLAPRSGAWPIIAGLNRPGRRLTLQVLGENAATARNHMAALQRYLNPEKRLHRRLKVSDYDVSLDNLLAAWGGDIAKNGSNYELRDVVQGHALSLTGGWLPGSNGGISVLRYGINALKNPRFENHTPLNAWTASNPAVVSIIDATEPPLPYLKKLMKIEDIVNVSTPATGVTPAAPWTFSFYMRRENGGVIDGDQVAVVVGGDIIPATFEAVGNGWYRIRANNPTVHTDNFGFNILIAGTYYVTGFLAEPKPFPGSTQISMPSLYTDGDMGPGHIWTGDAHDSGSYHNAGAITSASGIDGVYAVEFWWRSDSPGLYSDRRIFLYDPADLPENSLVLFWDEVEESIRGYVYGVEIHTDRIALGTGGLMHIVLAWKNSTVTLCVNGVFYRAEHVPMPKLGSDFVIGSGDDSITPYPVGGIEDASCGGELLAVRFYSELTDQQMTVLHEVGSDWNLRWVDVLCEECVPINLDGKPNLDGRVATLVVDGDVRYHARAADLAFLRAWSGLGGVGLENHGDDDAYPLIRLTPKQNKPSGQRWRRWVHASWPNSIGVANYPVTIGLNTSVTIAAGKMQADCNDIRVLVNGVSVDRWIVQPNTTSTKVWINLNFSPRIEVALKTAIADSGAISEIVASSTIAAFPTTGLLKIDSEVFVYNGRDLNRNAFLNVQRASRGTSMAAHNAAAVIVWVEHDIWLEYGDAGLAEPVVDAGMAPTFDRTSSSNTTWSYANVFFSGNPLTRWNPIGDPITGYTGLQYTGTPNKVTGIFMEAGSNNGRPWARGKVSFTHPVTGAITNGDFENGSKKIHQYAGGSGIITWQASLFGDASIVNIEQPPSGWDVWDETNDYILGAMTTVGFQLAISGVAPYLHDGYLEYEIINLMFDANKVPAITAGNEEAFYKLTGRLTNITTGDYIEMNGTMLVDQTITIDTESREAYLDDGTPALAMIGFSSVREDWLRLAPGFNGLMYEETDSVQVEIDLEWDRRTIE